MSAFLRNARLHANHAQPLRRPRASREGTSVRRGAQLHEPSRGGIARAPRAGNQARAERSAAHLFASHPRRPGRSRPHRRRLDRPGRRRTMLIVPDINVLIHAFRTDVEHHETYATWLRTTLRDERLGIADVITTGFLRTVTHPRIFAERTPTAAALDFIDVITARSRTSWLQQGAEPWQRRARQSRPRRTYRCPLPQQWRTPRHARPRIRSLPRPALLRSRRVAPSPLPLRSHNLWVAAQRTRRR